MLERFFPDQDVDSVYQIPFETLARQGVQGIIFDIDNTLVPHGAPADQRAKELFQKLKRLGIQTCLLSNNKEDRVSSFAAQVDAGFYIYKGGKPGVKNYRKAMELMGTGSRNTVFVGDQLFTDVYGAKKAGIPTILVKPIHPKEEIQIVIKRRLEAVVLYFYRRQKQIK